MKREIKFRAYRKSTQNVCDVLSIDFEKGWVLLDDGDEEDITTVELMQLTGLKDSKNREIYEGDILKVENEYRVSFVASVEWVGNNGYPGFDLDYVPYEFCDDEEYGLAEIQSGGETCEFIGNIYENPDLLEAQHG